MSQGDPSEGSEDVTDFLRRIKELSDKRDREDAERARKLEEEIMEGRKQREARRAERARSLSPEKQSPSGTPRSAKLHEIESYSNLPGSSTVSVKNERAVASTPDPSHSSREMSKTTGLESHISRLTNVLEKSVGEADQDINQSPNPMNLPETPERDGTLSWQQRLGSRREPLSRPVSSIQPKQFPFTSSKIHEDDTNTARADSGEILATRNIPKTTPMTNPGARLTKSPRQENEPEEGTNAVVEEQNVPQVTNGTLGNLKFEVRRGPIPPPGHGYLLSDTISGTAETLATKPRADLRFPNSLSPLPVRPSQRFPPPRLESSPVNADVFESTVSVTPPHVIKQKQTEIISRSISPTKGLGGFVQSAMLKRSDSVNKRWSVQTPSGLNQQDSVAGLRSESRLSQDLSSARNHSNGTVRKFETPSKEVDSIALTGKLNTTPKTPPRRDEVHNDSLTTMKLPQNQRSLPATSGGDEKGVKVEEPSSPSSPSKRWSPVKSSWLESALSKPSSPQLVPSSPQPTWLSDLNKVKQARSSRDLASLSQAQDVSIEPLSRKTKSMPFEIEHIPSTSTPIKFPPIKPKPTQLPSGTFHEIRAKIGKPQPANVDRLPERDNVRFSSMPSVESKVRGILHVETDFRSALKPPESVEESTEKDELEFRNIFGKLKRAHTGKNTPPDDLRGNILHSKATLSTSEAPQLTAKKDEFNNDVLKQRETLKTYHKSVVKPILPGKKAFLPSESFAEKSQSEIRTLDTAPHAGGLQDSSQIGTRGSEETNAQSSLPPMLSITISNTENEHTSNSKIATRFNPGLDKLLAKRTAAAGNSTHAFEKLGESHKNENEDPLDSDSFAKPNKAGQLQHMTKGRARGPKRRLPNAAGGSTDNQMSAPMSGKTNPTLPKRIAFDISATSTDSPEMTVQTSRVASETRSKPQTPPKSLRVARSSVSPQTSEVNTSSATSHLPKSPPLPSRPTKPSRLRSSSASTSESTVNKSERVPPIQNHNGDEVDAETLSVKDATVRWGRRTTSRSSDATEIKAPIKLPNSQDEVVNTMSSPVVVNDGKKNNPRNTDDKVSPVPQHNATIQGLKYTKSLRAPPKVGIKPEAVARSFSSTVKSDGISTLTLNPPRALMTQTPSSTRMSLDFFNEAPKIGGAPKIDASSYLYARPTSACKIKTLRKSITQIFSDGKTAALPSYQDHVLFDQSMYLCTHIFGDSMGARITEVYLWVGTSVSDASVQETQVFARKIAKDASGKLIVFRQGKETSNFLQAVGGIIITRSGLATDNRKSYMLCGRRHLGHIAFDEVELSYDSLCPGFPFIIVPSNDTIFVWKGCGCNPEELAGARLMSMDLGITGTVVEINQGQETRDFLSMFPSGDATATSLTSATYWKLKAKNLNYNVRLFHVEHSTITQDTSTVTALWNRVRQPDAIATLKPTSHAQITEIIPFCQADLDPENIYVLDAFFEVFIILGPLSTRKPTAYTTALLFAQDYAIQSASNALEERPFVPPGTVVFDGVPRDVKAVFRGWRGVGWAGTEVLMAGAGRGSGSVGAGEGERGLVRTLGLRDAIDACR